MFVRKLLNRDEEDLYLLCCEQAARVLPREFYDEMLHSVLKDPCRMILAAVVGDRVEGYADCHVELDPARCEGRLVVTELYVRAASRGKGVGSGLVISIAGRAENLGCTSVFAEASGVGVRGQEFLERHGFARSRYMYQHSLEKPAPAGKTEAGNGAEPPHNPIN